MFSTIAMLRQALRVKTASCAPSYRFLDRISRFCDSASAKDTSNKDTTSSTNKLPDESTVPDDSASPLSDENVAQMLQDAANYSDAKDTNWATSPYPAGVPTGTAEEVVRPAIDPLDTCVLLFPGQGTIKVGAVKRYLKFPQAKELFEIANEILNYDLLKLCLNGPQEKLNLTRFNQPATVLTSLAALEKLREDRPRVFDTCVAAAGYSIGELTSLIFSSVLSFEDGIRLVAVRGAAMQYASEKSRQGMMSVYCTPKAKLHEACMDAKKWAQDNGVESPVCQVAVYLYTQSKIIAGNVEALEYIQNNAEKYGLSKLTKLPVSGAFHTSLMEPALKSFGKMLYGLKLDQPRCKVYSNFKGHQHSHEILIRKYLVKQIVSPVRWEQCMQYIYTRKAGKAYPRTFDVGSGGRMSTILKLINAKAHDQCTVI